MPGYDEIGNKKSVVQRVVHRAGFGSPEDEDENDVPRFYRRLSVFLLIAVLCMGPLFAVYAPKLQGSTVIAFTPPSGHPSAQAKDQMMAHWPEAEKSSIVVLLVSSAGGFDVPRNCSNRVVTYIRAVSEAVAKAGYTKALGMKVTDYYTMQCPLQLPLASRFIAPTSTVVFFTIEKASDKSTNKGEPYYNFVQFLKDESKALAAQHFPSGEFGASVTGQKVLTIEAREGTISDAAKADVFVIPVAFIILALFLQSTRLMIVPLISIAVCLGSAFSICYAIAQAMSVQSTTPQLMMSATLAMNIDYNLFLLMRYRENVVDGLSLRENVRLLVTHTAMETVLGSGSLVAIAFFAMAIIPCEALISTGICCGVTIALVVCVNITVTPALLTLFHGFFTGSLDCWRRWGIVADNQSAWDTAKGKMKGLFGAGSSDELQEIYDTKEVDEEKESMKSVWYRIGLQLQRFPIVVIIVVLAIFSPLYIRFGALKTSLDPLSYVPRNSDSVHTWRAMGKSYSPGAFEPYYLVVSRLEDTHSAESAAALHDITSDVILNTYLSAPEYVGPRRQGGYGYVYGTYIGPFLFQPDELVDVLGFPGSDPPFACCNGSDCSSCVAPAANVTAFTGVDYNTTECLGIKDAKKRPAECVLDAPITNIPYTFFPLILTTKVLTLKTTQVKAMYELLLNKQLTDTAAYITISLPFSPTGKESKKWMDQVQDIIKAKQAKYPGVEVGLAGGNTITYDFGTVCTYFPPPPLHTHIPAFPPHRLSMTTCTPCLPFWWAPLRWSSWSFSSHSSSPLSWPSPSCTASAAPSGMPSIPLVSTHTLSSYSMGYYFFQTTSFSWIYSYLSHDFREEGVSWSVPPMVISITVALAIDYNIFMLTRIMEYKKRGMESAQAILQGMRAVGSTICGAGIIMSVAFGGLLFSHVVSLNQFSVILVTSVLLDTFLLCTIFVPACGFLLGDYFWAPFYLRPFSCGKRPTDDAPTGVQFAH